MIENPAHKRSKLVRITAAGQSTAEATARREAEILPELSHGLTLEEIETATRVLEHFKSAFEDLPVCIRERSAGREGFDQVSRSQRPD